MSKWQEELKQARDLWTEAENMEKNGNRTGAKELFKQAAQLYQSCLDGIAYNSPSEAVQQEMEKRAAYIAFSNET